MRYNSGVWFQPFLATPVRFTALYNNAETRRNARKVQLPPPYLIYWIIGIKLPHLCARRTFLSLSTSIETMAKPALQFPTPMSGVGSCGSLMRRFVRAHKTHLDPSWPSRHPLLLILSSSHPLSFSSYTSVLNPSAEVNKDGQIMERSHRGYRER